MLPLTVLLAAVLLAAVCAAPPGVAADSPSSVPVEPLNATVLVRPRRSGSADYRELLECQEQRQCRSATCSECGGDRDCGVMCQWNCECGCLEEHRGGLDSGLYEECVQQRGCWAQWSACLNSCGSQECKDSCWVDFERCRCECSWQQAGTTSTTTTPSTTTPSTTSTTTPSTTTPSPSSTTTPSTTMPSTTTPSTTSRSTATPSFEDWDPQMLVGCAQQCGEGGLDALSALRARNCTCGCMGLPGVGLGERGRAERCEWQRDCGGSERRCQRECGSPECRQACSRQALKCRCECGLEVQDWRTVTDCKAREQCDSAPCSQCGVDDWQCRATCRLDCECRCAGFHSSGPVAFSDWERCYGESGCLRALGECGAGCNTEPCRERCSLEYERCRCRCNQPVAVRCSS